MPASRSRPRIRAASSRVSAKAISTRSSPELGSSRRISTPRIVRRGSWRAGLLVGVEAQLAARVRVGDAEVQLGRLGGPRFVDARLLVERPRGGTRDDRVFVRVRGDLVQVSFSVSAPLPSGNEVTPHGRDSTPWEGFFN